MSQRRLSPQPAFHPGRKCVEASDDVIKDDFSSATDSRLLDFSPMRLGPRYAKFFNRSHDAVIRVYDEAGNVIEAHEYAGDFKKP